MDGDTVAPGDAAVARILDGKGRPIGAGFLIGVSEVLTCAHVVAKALGAPHETEEVPGGRVRVDFPLAQPGRTVEGVIESWTPVRADGSGDIAVLRLLSKPPEKAPVAHLVEGAAGPDRRVRTFGFPAGYDDGTWSVGWLRGRQGAGWFQYDTDPASQHRVELGFSGAPVWDVDSGGVVGMIVAADRADRVRTAYLIPTATLREHWPPLGELALRAGPFRALDHFHERDAEVFHGRDDDAQRVVDRLRYAPVTCLVGPSGSGKSSLLFAGVLPRLRDRTDLLITVLRPGRPDSSPLTALALALLPLLEPDLPETARLEERPRMERLLRTGQMPAIVERILARQGKDRLLVVLDQFEETLVGPIPADLAPLSDALRYSLAPGSPRLQVLLILRADFLTTVLDHPSLSQLVGGERLFTLGAMSDTELRAAIVRPLERTGVSYEPGLVDRILGDIGLDPGRLPLLQFTLAGLWERQRRGVIGHAAYETLGRVDDALATYAEQVWTTWLTEEERREARALLVQLVHPADGRTAPSRRVARRSELTPARWRLAQRLMTSRLIVPGEDFRPDDGPPEETVELAHETLLTQWQRLADFITADHEFRTWQEDVRRRAARWETAGRSGRSLLRGADLRDARGWLSRRSGELSPADRVFIDASIRAGHRRRLGLGAAVTAFALTVTSLVVTADRGRDAAKGLAESAARELWQQAVAEAEDADGHAYTALLLAMRAYRTDDTARTRQLLGQMHARYGYADLLVPDYGSRWKHPTSQPLEPFHSSDRRGRVIASQTGDGTGAIWTFDGSGFQRRSTRHSGALTAVSPDGSRVAFTDSSALPPEPYTRDADGEVYLYEVKTGETRQADQPEWLSPLYEQLVLGPDGDLLVGLEADQGEQLVWNGSNGELRKRLSLPSRALVGLAEPGLVTSSNSSTRPGWSTSPAARRPTYSIQLWDIDGGSPALRTTHTFKETIDNTADTYNHGWLFDASPDLTRLAVARYTRSHDADTVETGITVYELSSGKVLWRDQFTAEKPPDHIAVGDRDRPTLFYGQNDLRPQKTPVRGATAHTAPLPSFWRDVTLLGEDRAASLALRVDGLIAFVAPRDADADPLGRLPESAAASKASADFSASPSPHPDVAAEGRERRRAKERMDDLCRILGDDKLPPDVEKDLPSAAYDGPLCP
ncbi:nSTAND1 domain-containing NTPase [Streptomyces bluensis]|uniref:nSTAND1 domain-containing NTPase n=1 Tax=Streptomyces bluensis TaxID=33897 RepID=UPI003323E4EC